MTSRLREGAQIRGLAQSFGYIFPPRNLEILPRSTIDLQPGQLRRMAITTAWASAPAPLTNTSVRSLPPTMSTLTSLFMGFSGLATQIWEKPLISPPNEVAESSALAVFAPILRYRFLSPACRTAVSQSEPNVQVGHRLRERRRRRAFRS